ncbi:hypothetical protein OAK19_04525 [Aureispira]|nr:hypothetical protein [Aureispira sp.]
MDPDLDNAIEHIRRIISESLIKRNNEAVELEKKVNNFWNKIQQKFPSDFVSQYDENPDNQALNVEFCQHLKEIMHAQNIKMNVVMFLYNQGVEL